MFVEIGTSRQDIAYDSNGYYQLTRTFKVRGVDPSNFFNSLTQIPPINGGPSRMPDYGTTFQTVGGPGGILGAQGTTTRVTLYEYVLQPISSVVFIARARYSNDPRLTSNGGQDYRCQQMQSLVPIPYARYMPTIAGMGTGLKAPVEDSVNAPMALRRVSQTVTVPRSQRKLIISTCAANANCLHDLDGNKWPYKFEGFDLKLRGAQYYDVTYHWTWESGIVWLTRPGLQAVKDEANFTITTLAAAYPPRTTSLSAEVRPVVINGDTANMVLFPYHTIAMHWVDVPAGTNAALKKPVWMYRLQNSDQNVNGWQSLPQASKFEF